MNDDDDDDDDDDERLGIFKLIDWSSERARENNFLNIFERTGYYKIYDGINIMDPHTVILCIYYYISSILTSYEPLLEIYPGTKSLEQ